MFNNYKDEKKDSIYKDDAYEIPKNDLEEDDIGNRFTRRKPTNIMEIIKAVEEYQEIVAKEREISDPIERNQYKIINSDHLSELSGFISAGIKLDEFPLKMDIIETIVGFVSQHGLEGSEVLERLKVAQVFLSDAHLISAEAYNVVNNVFFDYRKANFDENGQFIGFKEEDKEFVSHVLVHEFYHILSSEKDDKRVSFLEDAYSEGFTEMLTEMTTGKRYTKAYSFPVSVCSLFRDIIGIDNVLDDYANHLHSLPNLRSLFLECGVTEEEFRSFHVDLNNILALTSKNDPNNSELIASEQARCVLFLKERIVEPYCELHPERAEEVRTSFNGLFPNQEEKEVGHTK